MATLLFNGVCCYAINVVQVENVGIGQTYSGSFKNKCLRVTSSTGRTHFTIENLNIDNSEAYADDNAMCIEIGPNNDIDLYLKGTNVLQAGCMLPAIKVSQSSTLRIHNGMDEGEGILTAIGGESGVTDFSNTTGITGGEIALLVVLGVATLVTAAVAMYVVRRAVKTLKNMKTVARYESINGQTVNPNAGAFIRITPDQYATTPYLTNQQRLSQVWQYPYVDVFVEGTGPIRLGRGGNVTFLPPGHLITSYSNAYLDTLSNPRLAIFGSIAATAAVVTGASIGIAYLKPNLEEDQVCTHFDFELAGGSGIGGGWNYKNPKRGARETMYMSGKTWYPCSFFVGVIEDGWDVAYIANTGGCGNIRIYSGVVNAYGGGKAPGIGPSGNGALGYDIEIFGGTVNAFGGHDAAGIGSAHYSEVGSIKVHGGIVYAQGGENAPGIGVGNKSYLQNLEINGGGCNCRSRFCSGGYRHRD